MNDLVFKFVGDERFMGLLFSRLNDRQGFDLLTGPERLLPADETRERTYRTVKRLRKTWIAKLLDLIKIHADTHPEPYAGYNLSLSSYGIDPEESDTGTIASHFRTVFNNVSLFEDVLSDLGEAGYDGYAGYVQKDMIGRVPFFLIFWGGKSEYTKFIRSGVTGSKIPENKKHVVLVRTFSSRTEA